jgi:hypothetical protein
MKALAKSIRCQFDESGRQELVLPLVSRVEIAELKSAVEQGKQLDVEVKVHRNRRSLNSNAYLWILLQKIAEVLRTDKDAVYLEMLQRYGQFTHIIVKPHVVDKIIAEWRTVRNLGEVNLNGQKGVQLQCYFGSSSYTTKEMAVLIDGVVSECKELGIETLPEDEIRRMSEEWGRE